MNHVHMYVLYISFLTHTQHNQIIMICTYVCIRSDITIVCNYYVLHFTFGCYKVAISLKIKPMEFRSPQAIRISIVSLLCSGITAWAFRLVNSIEPCGLKSIYIKVVAC